MSDRVLVVVCGPPGVGKTSVARTAADRLDARLLRTDVVRHDLFDEPRYTDEAVGQVYEEMHEQARATLTADRSVVLDGTYRDVDLRRAAADTGAAVDAAVLFLRVTCEEAVVRERIHAREGDESEAGFEDYRTILEGFDPLRRPHRDIDNSGTPARTERQVAAALAAFDASP